MGGERRILPPTKESFNETLRARCRASHPHATNRGNAFKNGKETYRNRRRELSRNGVGHRGRGGGGTTGGRKMGYGALGRRSNGRRKSGCAGRRRSFLSVKWESFGENKLSDEGGS
jgi:hypothetical protein